MADSFRAACIIGWPSGHSRSPLIHNYWIRRHGIAGEYRKEAVPPQEFAAFLVSLGERGFLVRNRDIGAGIAVRRQIAREVGEPFRRHGFLAILAGEAVLLDPVVVDQRRA